MEALLLASKVVAFPTATRRIGAQGRVAREGVHVQRRRLVDFVGNLLGSIRHGNNSKMQKTSRQTGHHPSEGGSSIGSCAHGRVVKRPPGP